MPNAKQLLYQTEKKQPSEVFYEKAILKNFCNTFGKTPILKKIT